jgi:hypothetical protein
MGYAVSDGTAPGTRRSLSDRRRLTRRSCRRSG